MIKQFYKTSIGTRCDGKIVNLICARNQFQQRVPKIIRAKTK